jgi:hypothetical protein
MVFGIVENDVHVALNLLHPLLQSKPASALRQPANPHATDGDVADVGERWTSERQ